MHLYEKRPIFRWKGVVVTVLVFVAVILLFGTMMSQTGATSDKEQAEMLRRAIRNAAVTHYAVEGKYPATLQDIVDNYGIVINEARFVVRYNVFAANIMPTITVMDKGDTVDDSETPKIL